MTVDGALSILVYADIIGTQRINVAIFKGSINTGHMVVVPIMEYQG